VLLGTAYNVVNMVHVQMCVKSRWKCIAQVLEHLGI